MAESYREDYFNSTNRYPSPGQVEAYLMNRGVTSDDARRAASVGAETADDLIGTGDTGGAVIGAREGGAYDRLIGDPPGEGALPGRVPRAEVPIATMRINPDVPDDRYISVYRMHRNADAPLDPRNPASRTNNEGAEGRRRADYGADYAPRLPYYIEGQPMESRFAGFPIRIEARIPESRVYDLQLDPKGYMARMSLEPGHPDRLDNITEMSYRKRTG
jgi:hypothetical protein